VHSYMIQSSGCCLHKRASTDLEVAHLDLAISRRKEVYLHPRPYCSTVLELQVYLRIRNSGRIDGVTIGPNILHAEILNAYINESSTKCD
jgi:hypothetical protein